MHGIWRYLILVRTLSVFKAKMFVETLRWAALNRHQFNGETKIDFWNSSWLTAYSGTISTFKNWWESWFHTTSSKRMHHMYHIPPTSQLTQPSRSLYQHLSPLPFICHVKHEQSDSFWSEGSLSPLLKTRELGSEIIHSNWIKFKYSLISVLLIVIERYST